MSRARVFFQLVVVTVCLTLPLVTVAAKGRRGRPKKSSSKRLRIAGVSTSGPRGIDANRTYRPYTEAEIAIVVERLSLNKPPRVAIKGTQVPRTTARNWMRSGLVVAGIPFLQPKLGAPTLLSSEDEKLLVDFCVMRCELDQCVDELLVRAKALELAKLSGRVDSDHSPFSAHWLKLFVERHPEVALRKGQRQSEARRAAMSEEQLRQYNERTQAVIIKYKITEKWQMGSWDETHVEAGVAASRVVSSSSSKSAPIAQGAGEHGESFTLGVGGWADGEAMKPFFILKGQRFPLEKTQDIADKAPGALYTKTHSGGSESDSMIQFVKACVLPKRPKNRPDAYQFLVVDQFYFHAEDLPFLNFCFANKIIVMGSVPHATHKLAPADTNWNAPLKEAIRTATNNFYFDNGGETMSNGDFMFLASNAYEKVMTPSLVMKAFEDNGLTLPVVRIFDALKHKIGDRSASVIAAEGEALARPLRIRSSAPTAPTAPTAPSTRSATTDFTAQPLPARLTAEYVMDPRNKLPSTPPDTWSRIEIYDALLRVKALGHRQLAEPALKRQRRILAGQLDSSAKELTAPTRLAALEANQKAKDEEAQRKAVSSAARKAKQTFVCPVAGCGKGYTKSKGLVKHTLKDHP